ncbi:hypothetical protein ACI2K4_12400 [Micromonospora sp. NPDC050397]|uniref:hypothetical protein n=1 Tax=Micromonospora sp. NPDC050397 TaxID=3364279 RepID=UPI00384B6B8B
MEQILRLAEEQARDHRAEAQRAAEEMLRVARAEANAILAGARDTAAGSARDAVVDSAGDDRQGGQAAK